MVVALKLKLLPSHAEPRAANPEAHDQYLLGRAFFARGSGEAYGRAVKALSRSVELDPGYAPAWAALGSARFWYGDASETSIASEETPKAEAAAEKAIALAPELADGYAVRSGLRALHLDWEGARADLERARALNPGGVEVQVQYGILLASLGRLPEAIAVFQKATLLDPLSAEGWVRLGICYLGLGKLDLAEAAAKRALEISPEHDRAARTLGFAHLLGNRLEEARAAFHRSLKLAPGWDNSGARGGGTRNPAAYEAYLLGRYHWNLRTTQGMIHATEAFKRAVALDSSYALAWTGLADAYVLSVPGEYNVPGIDRALAANRDCDQRALRCGLDLDCRPRCNSLHRDARYVAGSSGRASRSSSC